MHRARLVLIASWVVVSLACNNPARSGAGPMPNASQRAPARAEPPPAQASGAAGAAAESSAEPAPAAPEVESDFKRPPLAEGYQRYETMPIDVPVGASGDWAQWVGGPLDQDYDIIDITGEQSKGGHHALVYATVDAQPPGTTRIWRDEDQTTTRLMGGIGGEGGANVNLPDGIVFRVKKGSYIVVQTHYLNAYERPVVGRTVVDVKFAPVDRTRRVASILSSTSLAVDLPAREDSVMDVYCTVQRELRFLQFSNHMHDYGMATFTEFTDPQGAVHILKDDKTWSGDLALNPNFTIFDEATPSVVPQGSVLHTRCTWRNSTDGNVKFPTEMCVFFGFILNESDIYCTDGKWSEATSTTGSDGSLPSGGADEGAAGKGAADAGAAGAAGPGGSGCTSTEDQALMDSAEFEQQSTGCALACAFDPDVAMCTTPCLEDIGLSHACASCNATNIACGSQMCRLDCLADSASPACRSCVMTNCDPAFRACTGT